jgi:prefoldin subunit 5
MTDNLSNLEKTVAVIENNIEYLKKGIDEIRASFAALDGKYADIKSVTRLEVRLAKIEATIDGTKSGILSWLLSHMGEIMMGIANVALLAYIASGSTP